MLISVLNYSTISNILYFHIPFIILTSFQPFPRIRMREPSNGVFFSLQEKSSEDKNLIKQAILLCLTAGHWDKYIFNGVKQYLTDKGLG